MKKSLITILFLSVLLSFNSCGIYSFTGASIAPGIKTISIQYFTNQASLVQPTLSQTLTDALKDRFMQQTNLKIVNGRGDLNIEGAITNYSTQPVAIQSNDQAALNRLSITIRVTFTNEQDEKQNFETTFTRYEDYDSRLSLSSVEDNLIKVISEALVEDIFNKSVANW